MSCLDIRCLPPELYPYLSICIHQHPSAPASLAFLFLPITYRRSTRAYVIRTVLEIATERPYIHMVTPLHALPMGLASTVQERSSNHVHARCYMLQTLSKITPCDPVHPDSE